MITYQVKRTARGRHYVKALKDGVQIYVTRGAHTSAEPALVEARNYINGTPEEPEAETQRVSIFSRVMGLLKVKGV